MWPVWLVSLATSAKSFRDNPVIGSNLLNRMGLHIIRLLIARAVNNLRWFLLAPLATRQIRRALHEDGFAVVENYLDAASIEAIRAEVKAHKGTARQMLQGNTATQRILLDDDALSDKPRLKALTGEGRFLGLLRYGAATFTLPLLYVQRIRNGLVEAGADPQKTMHADTFHPTMKAWLFLEDVTPEKGPFTYVRGSNRLTWKRLVWEYRRSLKAAKQPDGYSEKGSFRALPEDLQEMGLPSPEGLCAKAGTLVIANTNGFHGRGQAEPGRSRLEIWAYGRPNPFNPLPGIPFRFIGSLQNRIMQAYWRKKDRDAARKNSRASWHLIDADQMTDF